MYTYNFRKRIVAFALAIMMMMPSMPTMAFADQETTSEQPGIIVSSTDNETQESDQTEDNLSSDDTGSLDDNPADNGDSSQTDDPADNGDSSQTDDPKDNGDSSNTDDPKDNGDASNTDDTKVNGDSSNNNAGSPPVLMMAPAPKAAESSTAAKAAITDPQYPQDLDDIVYLAIYTGSGFPGEPAWYSTSNYQSFTGNFEKAYFRTFANSAEGIFSEKILDDMVPGTGSGTYKVWGVFSTDGINDYIIGGGILDRANEEKIIKAVKGSRVDPNDYRIIWYVIKYQTDTYWHLDGIIVDAETYNVNYYGNGNTSGSAPTGKTGLHNNDSYTVSGNTGNLKNVRNGFGYTFLGWNTRADGTGTSYNAGDRITITGDISLYAQWETPTRDISVSKEWEDGNNRDNLRPNSVQIHLLQNDVHSGKVLTLNASNSWSGTWEDVPALDQFGNEIEYFVEEVDVNGYTNTVSGDAENGFLITNTHAPATVTHEVVKVWNDGDNRDRNRPAQISVQLYKKVGSGAKVAVGSAVTLNAETAWEYAWHDLYAYEGGQEVSYSAEETVVPAKYSAAYDIDEHTGDTVITNSYTPETVSLTVTKSWDDANDQDGIRPDSVVLTIYANGVSTGETVTVTAADNWQEAVTGLPKNRAGEAIVYSFVEEDVNVPANYTLVANGSSANDYTVTNKHVPANRELTVTKVWDDNNNQDGIRPYSVIVEVLADGSVVREIEMDIESYWTDTITDLPYNKNGSVINYTLREVGYRMTEGGARVNGVPTGHEVSYEGSMADGLVVKNTHTPKTDSRTVVKVWDDEENKYGMRPSAIQITLYENGSPSTREGAVLTLNDANGWSGEWTNLPQYSNGTEISYSVVETGHTDSDGTESGIPEDYSVTYSYDRVNHSATVTNTYHPKMIALNIQKVWNDNSDQDDIRPEEVTVRLQYKVSGGEWTDANSFEVLNAANEWEADFENLPQMAFNAPIEYRVVEDAVTDYTTTYSDMSDAYVITVTNTHEPEKTSLEIVKTWVDDNNRDGIRPASANFRLYADGRATSQVAELSADNGWSYKFDNLDKKTRGRDIVYTVVETAVPAGYTVAYAETVNSDGTKKIEITNTHSIEMAKMPVVKVWDDDSNRDGKRPNSVQVSLKKGETVVETKTLSPANNWSSVFEAPKYNNGQVIAYSISESEVTGYTSSVAYDSNTGIYTITNTHEIEKVTISAEKIWNDDNNRDGVRPGSVTFHLTQHGEHMGEAYKRVLSKDNNWRCEWTVPRYEEGLIANYVVVEENVNGYTASYERIDNAETHNSHVKVTNTRAVDKINVTVQKIWNDANNQDNVRPTSVQIQLTANGAPHGDPVTLTATDHWRYTFTGLNKNASGTAIVYSAEEILTGAAAANYESSDPVVDQHTGIITITNTHEPATVEISVNKVWDDNDNVDGKRPDSVTVRLYQNGVEYRTEQLNASNHWACEWKDLPKNHGIGLPIEYSVSEDPVDGYTQQRSVSHTGDSAVVTFTNTHERELTSLTVTKVWDDVNNQDGKRPTSLTLAVYADGVRTDKTITLNSNPTENWPGTITGLEKYKDGAVGQEIVYTAKEEAVPEGYEVVGDGIANAASNYKIYNRHNPEKFTISVKKVWNDNDNQDGNRPESVAITLYENSVPSSIANATLTLNGQDKDQNGNWVGTWANMPAFRNGKKIVYTVVESGYTPNGQVFRQGIPENYEVSYAYDRNAHIATVTNTYAPELTSLNVLKVWNDANNRDGIRPQEITVNLQYSTDNGVTWESYYNRSQVMNSENNWDVDFVGLPKQLSSKDAQYRVVEDAETGYTAAYSAPSASNVITVTNTHEPVKTSLEVVKVWNDDNNRDGIRPTSITLTLYADGVPTEKTATMTASGGWNSYKFEDLYKKNNGRDIVYTVVESEVTGYTTTYSVPVDAAGGGKSVTVTNTHNPEKVYISVQKAWEDGNNRDGIRPTEVTVKLWKDAETDSLEGEKKLNVSGNWFGVFEAFKFENGEEIPYYVTENKVTGYNDPSITGSVQSGFTITNTHEIERVTISAEKVWDDENNQDNKRPTQVVLHLTAGGVHHGTPLVLNEENSWAGKWEDLPLNNEGLKINYVVTEESVGNGYVGNIKRSSTDDNHVIVTNTRTVDKTSVTVQKVWNDANNQDNVRPTSVQIQLTANGVNHGAPVTLTAENHWRYTFTGLDKNANGTAIVYSAKEILEAKDVANYPTRSVSVDTQTGLITITNTHEPATVEISVNKVWADNDNVDGKRPTSVTMHLYRNGVELESKELNASNNWTYKWEELPKNYGIGLPIEYSVSEDPVEHYTQQRSVTRNGDSAVVTFTNTHVRDLTSLTVTKVWDDANNQDGKRPPSLTLAVYADDVRTDKTITLSPAENWTGTITGLNKYKDGAVGREIVYTAKEENVPEGYTVTNDGIASAGNGYEITNTHQPKLVDLYAKKVWNDADNQDGKRPYMVEVTLLDNGTPVTDNLGNNRVLKLSEANGWTDKWDDMPRYRNGLYISYSVIETAYWQTDGGARIPGLPDGYTVSHSYTAPNESADESTATLTNTYTPEVVGLNVQKIWDDNNNQDGIRPQNITVRLLANGQAVGQTAVMSAANEWDVDFVNLPKYKNGVEIVYSVEEVSVPEGYTAEYIPDSALNLITVKNTHTPAKTTVTVTKKWVDNNDQDGMRPDTVTLTLYADGVSTGKSATLQEDANGVWEAEFTELPLKKNGELISYRVFETSTVDGYTVSYSGVRNTDNRVDIVVTNTHEPLETSVSVKKTWADEDNQDGIRPENITVKLLADGTEVESKSISYTDNWMGTFSNKPKYSNGRLINYTVSEVVPTGYTGSTPTLNNGVFEITNTHTPEKIEFKAVKVWDDNENSDGKRPDSITLHLLANGKHMGDQYKKVVTAADNWTCSWNVDKYFAGSPIVYTVHEEPVMFKAVSTASGTPELYAADRYDAYYEYDYATNTATVTNKYIPETVTVSARKVWIDGDNRDGIRPDEVTVHVYRTDAVNSISRAALKTAVLNESNGWYKAWTDLPKYENGGTPISYTVVEAASYPGYVSTIKPETEYNPYFFILTSVHNPAVTGVSVKKVWNDEDNNDGVRPEGIVVQLFADGTPLANGRVTLSESNNWSVSWQSSIDYPLYVFEGGVEITYSVQEVAYIVDGEEVSNPPAGYTGSYTNLGYDFTITNSRATEKIDITINKVWSNANISHPASVSVSLLRNGNQLGEKYTLDEANGWTVVVADQNRYFGGIIAEYTVVEDAVAGYVASYSSETDSVTGEVTLTVTNSYRPVYEPDDDDDNKVRTITKVWRDSNDAEKLRPDYVDVQLYKNGKTYGDTIRLTADKNWKANVSLPVYDGGKKIEWTVAEVKIPRYYSVSYDQKNLTVTNTIQSMTVPNTGDYDEFLPWVCMFTACTIGAVSLISYSNKKYKPKGKAEYKHD